MAATVVLTMGELDRLQVMTQLAERRLTRRGAATLLGVSERQVSRLVRAFRRDGAAALALRRKVRRLRPDPRAREAHRDARPRALGRDTPRLDDERRALVPHDQRTRRSQPPHPRRAYLGEIVQIDGSAHVGFEDRGPVCTRLVYVDDATSRLLALAFADVESTFDCFRGTRRLSRAPREADGVLQRPAERLSRGQARRGPGRPGRVPVRPRAPRARHRQPLRNDGGGEGAGRAGEPDAPGAPGEGDAGGGLNDPAAAEPFLPAFMADYNARFAVAPRVAYDAHRPLRPADDRTQIFTLQEARRISRALTVHYKRDLYVLEDRVATRRFRGTTALVCEAADGTVTIRVHDRVVPARLFPKDQAQLNPGTVVEHQHVDRVFAWIAEQQQARDAARLASDKVTVREKQRVRAGKPVRTAVPIPAERGRVVSPPLRRPAGPSCEKRRA